MTGHGWLEEGAASARRPPTQITRRPAIRQRSSARVRPSVRLGYGPYLLRHQNATRPSSLCVPFHHPQSSQVYLLCLACCTGPFQRHECFKLAPNPVF